MSGSGHSKFWEALDESKMVFGRYWTVVILVATTFHSLTVGVSADVSITVPSTQNSSLEDVTVSFSQVMFTEFYGCLCEGTTTTCMANYDNNFTAVGVSRDPGVYLFNQVSKIYNCQDRHTGSGGTLACIRIPNEPCLSDLNVKYFQLVKSSVCHTQCMGILLQRGESMEFHDAQYLKFCLHGCGSAAATTSTPVGIPGKSTAQVIVSPTSYNSSKPFSSAMTQQNTSNRIPPLTTPSTMSSPKLFGTQKTNSTSRLVSQVPTSYVNDTTKLKTGSSLSTTTDDRVTRGYHIPSTNIMLTSSSTLYDTTKVDSTTTGTASTFDSPDQVGSTTVKTASPSKSASTPYNITAYTESTTKPTTASTSDVSLPSNRNDPGNEVKSPTLPAVSPSPLPLVTHNATILPVLSQATVTTPPTPVTSDFVTTTSPTATISSVQLNVTKQVSLSTRASLSVSHSSSSSPLDPAAQHSSSKVTVAAVSPTASQGTISINTITESVTSFSPPTRFTTQKSFTTPSTPLPSTTFGNDVKSSLTTPSSATSKTLPPLPTTSRPRGTSDNNFTAGTLWFTSAPISRPTSRGGRTSTVTVGRGASFNMNIVPIIIGIAIGVLAIFIIFVIAFLARRNERKRARKLPDKPQQRFVQRASVSCSGKSTVPEDTAGVEIVDEGVDALNTKVNKTNETAARDNKTIMGFVCVQHEDHWSDNCGGDTTDYWPQSGHYSGITDSCSETKVDDVACHDVSPSIKQVRFQIPVFDEIPHTTTEYYVPDVVLSPCHCLPLAGYDDADDSCYLVNEEIQSQSSTDVSFQSVPSRHRASCNGQLTFSYGHAETEDVEQYSC